VNVNPAYRSVDLAYVLRKSRMRALFLNEKDARADYRVILEEARRGQTLPLEHVVFFGTESWRQFLASGSTLPSVQPRPDDATNIQYTSGTTGSPKGVLLTHRNIVNNAWLCGEGLQLTSHDRFCAPFPLYHCAGSVCGALTSFERGATYILPCVQFDAGATLQAAQAEHATFLAGVPTMLVAMLEHPDFDSFDLSSIRGIFVGGAPCAVDLMKRVTERTGVRSIHVVYGQTESSPLITMPREDDPYDVRVSSVGCAMPNTEVKIVSRVTGETVVAGEQGELCTRGYLVMKGYDEEPEATATAIDPGGWLHTGDLATMEPSGHFHIIGRAKEMIIRGGENLFPAEIEAFLETHPKIAEACVVGLPDAKLGEIPVAWVRLYQRESATEAEVREFCHGKIAHFKIPQHVRFVDAFPMTVSGKVQKFRIRKQEIEERQLQQIASARMA
jgi:fatty-acyl-CoA synthase